MSDHKYDICICGHGQHEHEIPFRLIRIRQQEGKICKHCNCNVFESVGQLTFEEWMIYQRKIGTDHYRLRR